MITYEKSIFINRPQQEVWDFVSNPANNTQWQSSTEAAEWTSEGPPGEGSTYRTVNMLLGRTIETTSEVTIWNPPNQFGFKVVSGPFQTERTLRLESQENGTQLTGTWQVKVGGFFKIAEGRLGKQVEKQSDANLDALKLLLEAGQA